MKKLVLATVMSLGMATSAFAGGLIVTNNTNNTLFGREGLMNTPFQIVKHDSMHKTIVHTIRDLQLFKDSGHNQRICEKDITFEYLQGTNLKVTVNPDYSCSVQKS